MHQQPQRQLPAAGSRSALLVLLLAGRLGSVFCTSAESTSSGHKNNMTLAFVFDSTFSMNEELDQIKAAMQEIFDYMRINHTEIANYALVEFNDPEAMLLTMTNDSHTYQNSLDSIDVNGGDDCPEMSIEGIKIALEESSPNSYIFVFTDASAKDYKNETVVQDLIQQKKSKVIFILTGRCTDPRNEAEKIYYEQGYKVYENISHISNGYIFNLTKSDVNQVLDFIKKDVGRKEVICVKNIVETGNCTVPVDKTIDKISVTIAGTNASVHFLDSTGREVIGDVTLNVSSAISSTIVNPKTGKWTIKVRVQSAGRFIVAADSSFSIIYGFSTNSTEELIETTRRPIAGVNTSILVQTTNHTTSVHLTDIKVKDSEYNVLETLSLYSAISKNGTYISDIFLPPNSTFFLEVHGNDAMNNSVIRMSETGIMPLPPGPPLIALDGKLTAFLKSPFPLMCHVESSLPFNVTWYKDDVQISPSKMFYKTEAIYYVIDNVTHTSEGVYTCKADNGIGNASQSIRLHVKAPPPLVKTQYLIEMEANKTGEIPCQVESDLNYTIKWTKRDKSGIMRIINGAKFNIKSTGSLFISSVQRSDEGEYNCSAYSESGKGENNTFLKVLEPVKIDMTYNVRAFRKGTNIQLNCTATGSSPITLVWQKNDTVLQESDPRVKNFGEDKVILNISSGNASDEGIYYCKGRNKFSTDTARIELVYLETPSIKMDIPPEPGLVNSQYILQCFATGSPKPTITWAKDGHEFVPGSFEQILENGTLIIQKLSLNHTGEYKCIAENDAGTAEDSKSIEIGAIPQFIETKEEISIEILQTKYLPCDEEKGHPTPFITLNRTDGKSMSHRFHFNGSCVIQLRGALPEDQGTYMLTAKNKYGSSSKELEIHVTGLEKPVLYPDSNEVSTERKRKELTCLLQKGHPPPEVWWYKDGKYLDKKNLSKMNAKIYTNRSLIIFFVQPAHKGVYECRVSNIGGEDKRIVNLTVLIIPHIIGKTYTVIKVKDGESVKLPCEVHGNPKPKISWKKDEKNLLIAWPVILLPNSSSLFISSATMESNGTYECIAVNTVGSKKKKFDLFVEFSPPSVNTPDQVDLHYKERGEIPCQINSTLNYTVKWTKKDKSGSMVKLTSERITVKPSGPLIISSVEKTDQGMYRCIVQSLSGENSSDIVVNVIEPVHVTVPSAKEKFKMHGKINMHCHASGSPPITIQWIKNGTILKTSDPLKKSEENELILHIRDGEKSHAGYYTCRAYNKLNSDNATVQLEYLEHPKIKVKNPTFPSLIGNKYILQCFATGSPEPTISWLLNGTKIGSGKFAQVFKNGSLVIDKLSLSHSGLYSCLAENEVGEDSLEVPVDVGYSPWFDSDKEDIDVEVLKNTTIHCNVHGHPIPNVTWSYFNGSDVLSKRFSMGSSCSLHVTGALPDDDGTYIVTAKNRYGSKNKTFRLHITGLEKPVLEPSVKEVVSIEGKQKELKCQIQKGNPPPTVKWYKDGVELDESSLLALNATKYPNGSLVISDTMPASQGMYECRVSNLAGEDNMVVNLTVHSVPHIIGGVQTVIKVKSGESVVLPCVAEGHPKPTIIWMKDGKNISSSLTLFISPENSNLYISSVTKERNGTYECIAENSAGKNKKRIDLIVQFSPPSVNTPKQIDLHYKERGEIPCQINSTLNYTVKWTKKDTSGSMEKVTSERMTVKPSGPLIISSVEKSDQGMYRCIAQSLSGDNSSDIAVNVIEPVHVTVPSAKEKFKIHEKINLHCRASGSPVITMQWIKNGTILKRSIPLKKPGENELVLHIGDGRKSHAGVYTCEAQNELNTDNATVELEYLEPPKVTIQKPAFPSLKGSKYILQCNATGSPEPTVSWLKDEAKLVSGRFAELLNGTLIIHKLSLHHTGRYTCIAKNEAGEDAENISIEVGYSPWFNSSTMEVDIKFQRNGTLQCSVHGLPEPKITWSYLNGSEVSSKRFTRGPSCSMILTDARPEDEGTYIVTAENEHGSSNAIYKVRISGIEKPILATGERDAVSIVGERKELTCTVLKGNPISNSIWYKDGEKLEKDDLRTLGAKVFTNGSIIFRLVKLESEGMYECEVKNIVGTTRKRITLKVHAIPSCADKTFMIRVRKGNYAELPCNMYGVPKPTVMWLKDKKELNTTPTGFYINQNGNLFVNESTSVNNGTYECIVRNDAGSTKKIVYLLVHFKPYISPRDVEIKIKRGEKAYLRCQVDAFPTAKLLWLKDGHLFNDTSVTYSENSSNISLTGSSSVDGLYTCIAQNEEGKDWIEIKVLVQEKPKFKQTEVNSLFSKGENVTFSCDNDGLPTPTYTWYTIKESGTGLEKLDRYESVITFTNVDESFAGVYWCNASNSAGEAYKSFIVTYSKAPKIVPDLPSEIILGTGRDFEITCNAEGKPKPIIYWLQNGERFTSHKHQNILKISNAAQKDVALYTCVAGNYEGSNQQNMAIKLEEPPHIDKMRSLIPVRKVKELQKITISCPPISGNPDPSVRWYNVSGKTYLENSDKIIIKNNNRTLRIRKIKIWDTGIYRCHAFNKIGNTYAEMRIFVLKAPTFLIEEMTNSEQNKQITIGGELKLNCSNNGFPKPEVFWYKNNATLDPSLLRHAIPAIDTILIPKVHRTDAGIYKCIVRNDAGEIKSTFQVNVKETFYSLKNYKKLSTWSAWSPWSDWNPKCGKMERTRVRLCRDSEKRCWEKPKKSEESQQKEELCIVNGNWGEWNRWSSCSKSCGSGERRRQRRCDNPKPEHGGEPCHGPSYEYGTCKRNPCPIDGSWSKWSNLYPCDYQCSPSQSKRTRECIKPIPAFGGKKCIGSRVKYEPCTETNCPVNGGWSSWSPWSSCTATCGLSTRSRRRLCNNPVPLFGGAPCWGSKTETENCETETCDNTPTFASMKVSVSLNGKTKQEIECRVKISDATDVRKTEGNASMDIFRKTVSRDWFPYLFFVVAPITWLTAFQKDTAVNGVTLTKGFFEIQTFIKFTGGEELTIKHKGYGVREKTLSVEVSLQGETPQLYLKTSSKSDPYEEMYILTGPGELQASSKNVLRLKNSFVSYSSTAKITFDPRIRKRPGLVQILSRRNIKTTPWKHLEEGFVSTRLGKMCPPGYKKSKEGYCQDIDECSDMKRNVCHFTQTCINLNGSYECRCPSGFKLSATRDCIDVNECLDDNICSHHCENVIGSYKCLCPPGMDISDSGSVCLNLPDFIYTCPPKYVEEDGICKEENPCKVGRFCEEDQTCLSINERTRCMPTICPDGYRKEKKSCLKDCSTKICESGSKYSESLEQMYVKVKGPTAYIRNLHNISTERFPSNTYYRIEENEAGKPFKVKLVDDFVTLYATSNLPPRGFIPYRVTVVASIYDETDSTMLNSNKYIVNLYVVD